MWPIGTIGEQGRLIADAGEPIPQARRNAQSNVRIRTSELDEIQLGCHSRVPIVVYGKAQTTYRNGDLLCLQEMPLPGLDCARHNFGEVALAKSPEVSCVRAEHVKHSAPVIDDLLKLGYVHAADCGESR